MPQLTDGLLPSFMPFGGGQRGNPAAYGVPALFPTFTCRANPSPFATTGDPLVSLAHYNLAAVVTVFTDGSAVRRMGVTCGGYGVFFPSFPHLCYSGPPPRAHSNGPPS